MSITQAKAPLPAGLTSEDRMSADIAIIGAGPGGYSTALRAAELGLSVVLIERDDSLGGTCLNRGCIPTKALVTAARSIDAVRHASRIGIAASITGIDYGTMLEYKNHVVDTMTQGLSGLIAHRGIVVLRGRAALDGAPSQDGATLDDSAPLGGATFEDTTPDNPTHADVAQDDTTQDSADGATGGPTDEPTNHAVAHIITVTPSGARDHVQRFIASDVPQNCGASVSVTAKRVVLAMGSRPRLLPSHDFAGALIDSTQALSLVHFPATATIIGSGSIAVEFASIWSAGGCAVTMLIRHDRVLSAWDRRSGVTLTRELKRRGITVLTHTDVTGVDVGVNLGATVHYNDADGRQQSIFAELALVAIGRTPNTDEPWCKAAGIALDPDGYVSTDARGHTSVAGISAVGDITQGPGLASRAFEQGIAIAEDAAGLDARPVDDDCVAQVVFSSPEGATVGCTLEDARQRDDLHNVRETIYPVMSNARMLMSGSAGSLSIVSGERDEQPGVEVVLGVHMVVPNAGDMIGEAQQIIAHRIPLHSAAGLTHPHPTFSETFGEALLLADGRPLHTR